MNRRHFILRSSTTLALLAAGLLRPLQAWAAEWNKPAFEAKSSMEALKALRAESATDSKEVLIKAPEIAENGTVVPVEVNSKLPNTEWIALIADKNPSPLIAQFEFGNGAEGYIHVRVKLAQSTNLKAVVKAGGKYYSATRAVTVTTGGCGG